MEIKHLSIGRGKKSSSQYLWYPRAGAHAKSLTQRLLRLFVLILFIPIVLSSCKNDDSLPDYLNTMMVSNRTSYDWFKAEIQFLTDHGAKSKRVEIGMVERFNSVHVQKEDDYFIVIFNDKDGVQHSTEKYLTDTAVGVETVAN